MKRSNVQKKQIVDAIAREKNFRASLVLTVVNSFLKKILDSLGEGARLEFRDFGVFEIVRRKARVGRNPMKAKLSIKIPPKNSVKFTPGRKMKKVVS